jgi:coatomer protein complex subunit epsilon
MTRSPSHSYNLINKHKGGDKYQAAYYVFEELAQAAATQSVQSLVSQAVAELHLGRYEEAEAALKQAQQLDPENPEVLANLIVLNTIQGKDYAEAKAGLEKVKKDHELLVDFKAKEEEFARALEKYSPKFEP